MKVVSLFGGCGGLDLGLIKAGHKIAFVNGEGTGIAKNIIQSSGATPDISFTYTYNATNAVNYPATLTFVGVVSTFFYE